MAAAARGKVATAGDETGTEEEDDENNESGEQWQQRERREGYCREWRIIVIVAITDEDETAGERLLVYAGSECESLGAGGGVAPCPGLAVGERGGG